MPFSRPPLELEDPSAARPHVLVATGDERFRARVTESLRADRLRVSSVEDGVELFERIDLPPRAAAAATLALPDVIVAQVELDGFTALEILAMTEARGRPPTVLVCSQVDVPLRLDARRLGAAALLTTTELISIRKAVRSALRTRRRAPRAA